MNDTTLKLVKSFMYSSEAFIYKGKLESAGIQTFIHDNHTVDSNPLYSNAIGGVKLLVNENDYEKAMEVLGEVNLFSVDDSFKAVVCPECGSEKVQLVASVSFPQFIVSFLAKDKYRCEACGNEFTPKK